MKSGIIFDIKHYAVHDGPGIRQTVFFKGCPLQCWWCHNPESQAFEPEAYVQEQKMDGKTFRVEKQIGQTYPADELLQIIEKDVAFFDTSGGGVTFGGGEPLSQGPFLLEMLKLCKERDIHTTVDTCGYASRDWVEKIAPFTDLFLFDLKLTDDELHQKYTGVSNRKILENLDYLAKNHQKLRIRIPLVPGITDTKENISAIVNHLNTYPNIKEVDILPYHAISKSKYKRFNKEFKMEGVTTQNGREPEVIQQALHEAGYTCKIGG